jgi:hypothetical protein
LGGQVSSQASSKGGNHDNSKNTVKSKPMFKVQSQSNKKAKNRHMSNIVAQPLSDLYNNNNDHVEDPGEIVHEVDLR